jgi:predicted enzyme related to lactoylglutathione lyase
MTAPDGSGEPGINGGIVGRKGQAPKGGEPVSSFVCTIHVPSVDEYLKKVQARGGAIALPKMPIPGLAWLAYCKDIEGNIFGLYEDDSNAK